MTLLTCVPPTKESMVKAAVKGVLPIGQAAFATTDGSFVGHVGEGEVFAVRCAREELVDEFGAGFALIWPEGDVRACGSKGRFITQSVRLECALKRN